MSNAMPRHFAPLAAFVIVFALIAPADAETSVPNWFMAPDSDNSGGHLDRAELTVSASWLRHFDWYAANRDGRVSIAEYEAKGRARFVRMDHDGDGRITRDEIDAMDNAQSRPNVRRSAG